MAIILECAQGHKLRVNDDLLGKKVRCPQCQTVVQVEQAEGSRNQKQKSSPRSDSEEFDDVTWNDAEVQRLPTRSPRAKSSRSQASDSSNKTPLVLGAVGAAVVVVVLGIILARRPASRPNASETDSTTAQPVAAATEAPVGSVTAASPKSSGPAAQPGELNATNLVAKTAIPKDAPVVAPSIPVKGGKTESGVSPPQVQSKQPGDVVLKGGVAVWDTADAGEQGDATQGAAKWNRITPQADGKYRFRGDCIIENEKLQLRVPRDEQGQFSLSAKGGMGQQATMPIAIFGRDAKPSGSRSISVVQLSGDSVTVESGPEGSAGRAPKVAFHVLAGKSWIEIKPVSSAERVSVGVKSQLVVVPSEFSEDLICDSSTLKAGQTVPLPHENRVLALQCDGNFMSVLTFPSTDQAGELTIGSGERVSNHGTTLSSYVSSMSAKFNGKSVFVGLLPQKDNWYYEAGGKKYSASGQYEIPWKPPYPGVWRLAGRVKGQYFMSDVADSHFIFACSQSGTLDFIFAYLSDAAEGASSEVATPLTVFRETLEGTAGDAPLSETEKVQQEGALARRKTKYRDVCNSVDDMKDTWRSRPEALRTEPDYVSNLLRDAKSILDRMDQRLGEFRGLAEDMDAVVAQMKQKESSESRAFLSVVQKSQAKLKAAKIPVVMRADEIIDNIEQKLQRQSTGRLNVAEMDRLAESLRDIASHQEVLLKKQRAITIELAEVCTKRRTGAPETLQPFVTMIGRHCRKVLRNRDPEE